MIIYLLNKASIAFVLLVFPKTFAAICLIDKLSCLSALISDSIAPKSLIFTLWSNNTKAIDALFEAFKNNDNSEFFVLALTPAIENTNYKIESYITKVLEQKGNEKIIDVLISALNNNQSYAVKNIYSSKLLARLVQYPELDIYRPDFFFMARKLAIRFSKKDLDFIPVYPERVTSLKPELIWHNWV